MAQVKTDTTPIDDAASKAASSDWLSIVDDIFPRCNRLGSSEAAKAKLRALFDDPETRLRIRRVDTNGKDVSGTRRSVGVEFCQRHLSVVSDPDSGDDQIAVDYGDPYVDYYAPGGRWELEVRRRDAERWEHLHPKLAAPPPPTAGAEKRAIAHLVPLLKQRGDAMTKAKAWNECKQFNTSYAGFENNVWPTARERAGLERKAPPGKKKGKPADIEFSYGPDWVRCAS